MSFVTLFLACLYISMWTTRPVFRYFRSARLLACFALMTASFIQGELGLSGTTFSFSGACLFRRPRRVALYRSRRSSAPSGEPVTRGDWAILARNSDLLMPLTFLHFITFRGNRGLEGSVPIVSKKWSDMYMLSTLTEITSVLGLDKTECPKCDLLHASAQWQTDIKAQWVVQLNKTPCIRVVGLIHVEVRVTNNKYVLSRNAVIRKKHAKLIEEITSCKFVSGWWRWAIHTNKSYSLFTSCYAHLSVVKRAKRTMFA